jgi:SGNH hydrolase-like domain, acetyltransferase AlgX
MRVIVPSSVRRGAKQTGPATGRQSGDTGRRSPRYDGILQGIGSGSALGWAADYADPDARVTVTLVVDGEAVAEGLASIARPDLASLELGDGAHGFLIELPDRLKAPARRSILVLAGPERVPIPVAPSFWQKPASDGSWSDVVFEPAGTSSGLVPPPPERPPTMALVESDGWLFAEEESSDAPASEAELERAVAVLAENTRKCAKLGVAYLPALIPSKREALAPARAEAPGALGRQLRARLRDLDGVDLLDLLDVLRDAARHGACYHRTDADWNDRGAFFVARALLKEAHKHVPALHPPPLADLHLRQIPGFRGTLADRPKVQRLGDELVPCELDVETEDGVTIDAGKLRALRMPVERHLAEAGRVHLRVYGQPAQDDRARLTLLGDDAALTLVPWLAERASRTTFFWTDELPVEQLELELPAVALQLVRVSDLLGERPPAPAP